MNNKKHRIALVQMKCEKGAIDENLRQMEKYIAESLEKGAEIVCFPEMNITGYIDPSQCPQAVITLNHPAIRQVLEWSSLYSIVVIAGLVEQNLDGKPYITQFVASDGKLLGFYRKKTIKEGEEEWFAPGNEQPIFSVHGLTFGLSVCADIDDPDIFRVCAKQGAAIVLESAAPGLYGEQATRNWSSGYEWWRGKCKEQLGAYAAAESIYIGVSTQAGRTIDEDFPGGGYLFDSKGVCVAESGDWSEGVLYVEIEA